MSSNQQMFPANQVPTIQTSSWIRFADCLCAIAFVAWILIPKALGWSGPLFWGAAAWSVFRLYQITLHVRLKETPGDSASR